MPKLNQIEFEALVARVRAGDQEAATELVRVYEPEIRREVRLRLTSAQLRRTLDSVDICQSVFGRFFIKAALGELEFDHPQQLLRLLCQMARNKVIDRYRRDQVRRPDDGEEIPIEGAVNPRATTETPSQIIQREELITRVSALLTSQEREIAAMRRNGETWSVIAQQVGGTAESVRKTLSRTCERVIDELGIDS
ncbi:MAG: sigma-70 family RNA polymerase sigma factor [Pirellulaceae bacterium]|nr:sigma-70 family RNA polymerase sigma factor [Pirellulaceae bacterium]